VTDRPANHNVEHYSEEDDGHSGGDSDQHHLTVLTGDGKGWGRKRERERERERGAGFYVHIGQIMQLFKGFLCCSKVKCKI